MTVGDQEKHGQIEFVVRGEGYGQRILSSHNIKFFGFSHEAIAESLSSLLVRGPIIAVVAPDHGGTASGVVVVQEIATDRKNT